MNENLGRPSDVPSVVLVFESLQAIGLTKDDIVALVRNRMKGTPAKRDIEATLDAVRHFERLLMRANGVSIKVVVVEGDDS